MRRIVSDGANLLHCKVIIIYLQCQWVGFLYLQALTRLFIKSTVINDYFRFWEFFHKSLCNSVFIQMFQDGSAIIQASNQLHKVFWQAKWQSTISNQPTCISSTGASCSWDISISARTPQTAPAALLTSASPSAHAEVDMSTEFVLFSAVNEN